MTTYTEKMWEDYVKLVSEMWSQGYDVFEISRVLESSEEIVKAVIEKHCPGTSRS